MISRRVLWSIALGIVALLLMTWHAGGFPARVTVINRSSRAIDRVVISAYGRPYELGSIRGGETRSVSIPSGARPTLSFGSAARNQWESTSEIAPGQSVVLYVSGDADGGVHVEMRDRIGGLAP